MERVRGNDKETDLTIYVQSCVGMSVHTYLHVHTLLCCICQFIHVRTYSPGRLPRMYIHVHTYMYMNVHMYIHVC